MRSIKSLAVGAGFCFVTLAMFVQGFLPAILPESRTKQVSRAVRTDLGDVKWVRYESSDYSPLESLGRAVYIREGCWYCHSQYVRPVARSEEHTSELQSHSDLVCRLLLEKKKKDLCCEEIHRSHLTEADL